MAFINRILGSEKNYKLQYRALHLLLFFGMILGVTATIVNLFTGANSANLILPMIATLICAVLYYYARRGKKPYISKIIFILFIDFIYFPLAWFTSSGSLSSMPYYSILFLVVTFLIIEYRREYVMPVLFLLEAIILMYIEVRWPFLFTAFEMTENRVLSLAIHYSIVVVFLGAIMIILLGKYIDINKNYERLVIRDELTGLYTRTYGIKQLKSAFESSSMTDEKYILLIFELYQLKDFNTVNGPLAGDELLKSLSDVMLHNSRSADICSRYGGNEFLVMLEHTDITQIDVYLQRIYEGYDRIIETYEKSDVKLLVGKADFDYNGINEVMRAAVLDLEASKKELQS